jgi:hypothetical protein
MKEQKTAMNAAVGRQEKFTIETWTTKYPPIM